MFDLSDPQPTPIPQVDPEEPGSEEGEREAPASVSSDCGDFADACAAGYTFFRGSTQVRSTADQFDKNHEWVYIVYDPSKETADGGAFPPTGTTYGTDVLGTGSQAAIYFVRYDGATGTHTAPKVIDNEPFATGGHQLFPDISSDGGTLHVIWWDSRNDACYSPIRPIGNCADKSTVPALDVFASKSTNAGATWATATRLTGVTSNPNYEQFDNRMVPFAGDYLYVTSLGDFAYGTWTDWRNTRQGSDPREGDGDSDGSSADVYQCRIVQQVPVKGGTVNTWSTDRCPHSGGLDQDIFGDFTP
jgi:hypothetical protein